MVTVDEAIRRILSTLSEAEDINIEDLRIASNKFIVDNNVSEELAKVIDKAIDRFI